MLQNLPYLCYTGRMLLNLLVHQEVQIKVKKVQYLKDILNKEGKRQYSLIPSLFKCLLTLSRVNSAAEIYIADHGNALEKDEALRFIKDGTSFLEQVLNVLVRRKHINITKQMQMLGVTSEQRKKEKLKARKLDDNGIYENPKLKKNDNTLLQTEQGFVVENEIVNDSR